MKKLVPTMKTKLHLVYTFFLAIILADYQTTQAVFCEEKPSHIIINLSTCNTVVASWKRKNRVAQVMPDELVKLISLYLKETCQKIDWEYSLNTWLIKEFHALPSGKLGLFMQENLLVLSPKDKKKTYIDYPEELNNITCIGVARSGKVVIYNDRDKKLIIMETPSIYDNHDWKKIKSYNLKNIIAIKMHTEGKYFVTLHSEGNINLYKIQEQTHSLMPTNLVPKGNYGIDPIRIVLNSETNTLYFSTRGGKIWYITTNKNQGLFFDPKIPECDTCFTLATAGNKLVASYLDSTNLKQTLVLKNLSDHATKKNSATIIPTEHSSPIGTLTMDNTGTYLFSSSSDKSCLWKLKKNQAICIKKFYGQEKNAVFMHCSSLGTVLYSNGFYQLDN